jgi:hypothetical protein
MSKQTAVEWLESETKKLKILVDGVTQDLMIRILEQAKQMEKEQTINFAKANLEMSKVSQDYTFSYNHRIDSQIAVLDKYYNETYGDAKV